MPYQANFFDSVGGTVITRLINAGEISTRGLELDVSVRPLPRLRLNAAVAFTEAQVDNFNCPPNAAASCQLNGKTLPFSPRVKTFVRAAWSLPPTQDGQRSRQQLLTSLAQGENLSIRQLYERIAGGRRHFTVIGTAAQVADQMQAWFEQGAADGFNLMPPSLPLGLTDVLDLVVPELVRRAPCAAISD